MAGQPASTTEMKDDDLNNTTGDELELDPHFEAKLKAAMELPVPELRMPELPEIETSNVLSLGQKQDEKRREETGHKAALGKRTVTPAWFAVAASVALVAIIGVRIFGTTPEYESLTDEIVAHLDHEPYALRVTDKPVSDRRLARIVPSNIANLDHDAGLITYAQNCNINGNTVPHLVIQGKKGPVTVILLPEERVSTAETFEGEGINGVLIPVGDGSIAIIGEKDEDLRLIQENVKNSVTWST